MDSLASRKQTSFVLILLDAPLPQFLLLFIILQSIAGETGVSNFLRAFLMVSLNSLSSGSMLLNRSLAIFVHCQDGAFHATTFSSPSAWHSFPFCPTVLAIDDLAWMSAVSR